VTDTPPDGERRRLPRFNHVAMSLAPDALDEASRRDIVAFYGDVFGWIEQPSMTLDRERLVLSAHRFDQFVFLIADDEPMWCPRLDHFGMAVDSHDELEGRHERAARYAEKDDRVDLVERDVDDHEVVKIHNFYVGYLLPMMVEVQYFEVAEGVDLG
jgi:hypothetical protein